MSGVREDQAAGRADLRAKAGSKAAVGAPAEVSVQAIEHLGGSEVFLRQCSCSAHDERAQHRGAQSLAAHISHQQQRRAVRSRINLIKVSAHFARRAVGGLAGEGLELRQFDRDKLALYAAGGLHLRAQPLLLARGACKPQHQHGADGEVGQCRKELFPAHIEM